jgi:hypothetical protein
MKTKKHYLILAVVTAILCAPAPGEIEPLLPEDSRPILIGKANPQLAGIEQLYVELRSDMRISHLGITTLQDIHEKVERKLNKANIKIISRPFMDSRPVMFLTDVKPFRLAKLRIDMSTLKLEDSQQYVFRIQASISREVRLARKNNFYFKADVWKTEPVMQAVSVKSMPAKVTDVVLEQVEVFIHAYLAANPSGTRPPDANDIAVKLPKPAKPDAKPAMAEHKYIASKNSKVFHKPDCRWAKRIKPANLVGYNSRNEAIEAGKRPCKVCKP